MYYIYHVHVCGISIYVLNAPSNWSRNGRGKKVHVNGHLGKSRAGFSDQTTDRMQSLQGYLGHVFEKNFYLNHDLLDIGYVKLPKRVFGARSADNRGV